MGHHPDVANDIQLAEPATLADGGINMQEPSIFQVVYGDGQVYAENLTSTAAFAMASFLVANGNIRNVRTEPMAAPVKPTGQVAMPRIVATAMPLPDIEPGKEREALRQAIEAHLDASARLDDANQAVDRAQAFLTARQAEADARQVEHGREVQASGETLAAILKAGGITANADHAIDRSALANAEIRRDTARAALEHLAAEQAAAGSAHTIAESAVRLAMMAVKRADVATLVERLINVKAEFTTLVTAIDAARFSDVPVTPEAQHVMHIEIQSIDEAAKTWHRYSAALRDDPDAVREDFA
jgi:hypothetical protein